MVTYSSYDESVFHEPYTYPAYRPDAEVGYLRLDETVPRYRSVGYEESVVVDSDTLSRRSDKLRRLEAPWFIIALLVLTASRPQ